MFPLAPMKPSPSHPAALVAAATTTLSALSHGAAVDAPSAPSLDQWLANLQHRDDAVCGPALAASAQYGPAGLKKLCPLLGGDDIEPRSIARRAAYVIIYHAGRPGADSEARAVEAALLEGLQSPNTVRGHREILWMLSVIGGDPAVPVIAGFLTKPDLRPDACMCLQRIPTPKALQALHAAYASAPADFKRAVAEALARRGAPPDGFKSTKLAPVKPTTVQPPSTGG